MKKLATIAVTSLLLGLSACGDDRPDPIPSSSASASPAVDVSPAPSAPALDDDQKADYEAALDVYEQYKDLLTDLGQNPRTDDDVVARVVELTTLKEADGLSEATDELIQSGAHTEGERDVAWIVPTKVEDDLVALKECETPGDWKLVGKDGDTSAQESNTVTDVQLTLVKGRWYVDTVKGGGEC